MVKGLPCSIKKRAEVSQTKWGDSEESEALVLNARVQHQVSWLVLGKLRSGAEEEL